MLTKNAKVWITARDPSKGEATLEQFRDSTGKDAHLLTMNLANPMTVKGAAREFNSLVSRPLTIVVDADALIERRSS